MRRSAFAFPKGIDPMSVLTHERARVASLTRSRSADDPDLVEARRNLAAERIAVYVAKTVESAPPLTDAQRERIAMLLRPAMSGGASDAA